MSEEFKQKIFDLVIEEIGNNSKLADPVDIARSYYTTLGILAAVCGTAMTGLDDNGLQIFITATIRCKAESEALQVSDGLLNRFGVGPGVRL